MAKKFLSTLKIVNLPSDPISGSEGELYFNTSASVAKVYQAGAWSVLGAGAGGGTTVSTTEPPSPEIGDSWYKNDTGEFYVYDGTYWVEVNGVISLSQEEVQDYVAPLFTHGNHVNASVHYEDELNQLHIEVTSAPTAGFTSVLKHDVKLNGSIAKGQAVYVSSANGTNIIVSKASNTSEATSSKTLGLLETGGSNNSTVKVVTEGLLAGLDTSSAGSAGDPVWLGTDGNLIYGLVNKPYAPAHLVFIGIVTRKNNSNGEIFVKVQNGFELAEIHDVGIGYSASIQNNELLAYDDFSGAWINKTAIEAGLIDTSATEQTKTGNLIITGNLTVNGTTTTLNTENLNVEDNIIILNSGVSGSPSLNSGIEIERGSSDNVSIIWNEESDKWNLTNDGTTSYPIATQNGYTYDSVINIRSYDGITDGAINLETYLNKIQLSDDSGIILTTGAGSINFAFNNNGELQFSDASIQDTAFLGMSSYSTTNLSEGTNLYFTDERAVDALDLTLADYLTTASATSTYLTQNNASVTYQPIGSYLTSETDPVFAASDAYSITSASTSAWNTAYGWGDHSSEGYLTAESDPVFAASDAYSITSASTSAWNTAYGWGDHSIAGYSSTSHNHSLDSLSNVVITGTPSDGQAIVWDTSTSKWVNETVSGGASYPDQTGNNGKFLQTNGTSVSWQNVDFTGYLTESSASTNYLTKASASTTYQLAGSYLTSESDTFETVTDRGASSTNAITISNTTEATNATTGALIVSGGVGVAKDLWIDGNLHVAGTTTTENTKTVATHDNLIYLNAALDSTITNAVYSSGSIIYTADNLYVAEMDIRITGVSPSAFNISSGDLLTVASATPTQFVVIKSDPGASYISGGTAHAKEEANPDLGFAGGYYDAGYAHAGLFRDASDGVFKFFQGYTPEPDEAVNIDTTHASFAFADIQIRNIKPQGSSQNDNFGIGYSATANATGFANFGIGQNAFSGGSGTNNFAIGDNSLENNTGGSNFAFGGTALADNTGSYNYGIGYHALENNSGWDNYSIGPALYGNTGDWNYAVGYFALSENTGDYNSAFGYEAGVNNTGSYNVYIGKSEGLSTSNNIVIADNEGYIRAQYLSASAGWTLGTVVSGTWLGSTIGYQYGGTGLTTLGTAGQVLTVNAGATALEWADASGGGSSFTNSSELAALLSDETGSGLLVFNTNPTFIQSINIGDSSVSTQSQNLHIGSGRTDSGYAYIDLVGDTTYTDYGARFLRGNTGSNTYTQILHRGTGALQITAVEGGSIQFGTSNVNRLVINSGGDMTFKSTVNTDVSTGTTSATSSFDTTVYSSAEFIVYGSTASGNYVSKVLMLARGTATPVITEYAILTQGTAPTVTITPSYSAPNAVLTVAVTSGTNIEIVKTAVSI
jgi:hypothetical protein